MSYVYEARQAGSGETVAVKVLSPKLSADKTAVERLRREAGLAMRLDHPNVCPILRLGETEDGLIYLVMPFLQGELENVMLEPNDDGTERAVIMDFGLAKDKRSLPGMQKLTATGVILGTPEFMSPEQVRGKPLDARSDVYSLGILAFEMLTGKLPFEGRNPQEMMIARLRGTPISVLEYRPDLPPKLAKALTRAMETAPEKRFVTVEEFGQAVAQSVKGGLLDKLKKRPE
jgi:serine/threonine-protein kinase